MPPNPKRKRAAHRKGVLAEWLALSLLMAKGYWPCARRYKTPVGEIDLIVRKRGMLVFVEVKARQTTAAALGAITPQNQQRVARAAQYYLSAHPEHAAHTLRLDAVAVPWYGWPQHHPHAFTLTH